MPLPVRCALFALAVLCWPAAAHADGVIYRVAGCGSYLFVSTPNGYSVLTGDGFSGLKEEDALTGDLDRIGMPMLFDRTAGRSVFAQVVDRHLTLPEITQRIAVRCRAPLADAMTSGSVSRATNCGNKIFVNTPQGYTVMVQISGGTIAEGDILSGNFNKPGRANVTDRQTAMSMVVFVQDLWLSKTAADRKMATACRS